MYVPIQHECIRFAGHEGLFMVLSVDYNRQLAELIGVSSKEKLIGIPFGSLFASYENPPKALVCTP